MANQDHPSNGVTSEDTPYQTFNFGKLPVRTINRNDEVWFVAADVCSALTLPDTHKAVARLDEDEKGRNSIPTHGGAQEMTIINESGLYSLVLSSRKPEAKRFKRWVTHEVLPTIRKQGYYQISSVAPTIDSSSLMLEGQSAPRVERPASIDAAIDRRAWDMAREAYELSRQHLHRRVAFQAESGYRQVTLNEQAAMQTIEQTSLDSALTQAWLDKIQSLRTMVSGFLCAGVNLVEELDAIEQQFAAKPQQHNPSRNRQ
ncbi:MAG: Bro-N domain-containing protein [Pusillimonas sp.]|nr:hypothetical protein [Pusillimonas sp.]MBC7203290.1 Bro-N domain-containing protein [Pusillimonas sp.]HCN73328.1 hypothetical protein [Pusillimonas sp.]HCP77358.1 hypothetical protein [Pusillimonas sp.]|tara:strand:- start:8319 stop:9095 length:777 start_codon:yes stop_codon:yes gene_type:complete